MTRRIKSLIQKALRVLRKEESSSVYFFSRRFKRYEDYPDADYLRNSRLIYYVLKTNWDGIPRIGVYKFIEPISDMDFKRHKHYWIELGRPNAKQKEKMRLFWQDMKKKFGKGADYAIKDVRIVGC